MISIVIPLYNKERQIAKTLHTVLGQTFQDFEVVIVNDGSTDGSVEAVMQFDDQRVRLINQPNGGVSAARNRGIAEARGEFVAFLDADDEWMPDYLETQHCLTEMYPDCDVFATNYKFVDEFGSEKSTKINLVESVSDTLILEKYFHVASNSDSPLWTSAVMARKNAITDVGGFPNGVTSGEDLYTWAKLAVKYKIAYCSISKAIYYTPTTGPTGRVPVDLQSTNDFVGTHLAILASENIGKGIEEYVSFWYKMRGVINLRRGNRMAAAKCALKSIRYNWRNKKSLAILVLSIAPAAVLRRILH